MLKLGDPRVAPRHHPRVHAMRRILAAAGWLCLGLAPLSAESNTPPAASLSKLIEQVCDDARLYVYHNENNGMQLYHQDNYWPHVAYNGPFKLTANNLHYSKSITLGGQPRNPGPGGQQQTRSENLQFSFNVMSEP